jgi:hypothetical protein
MLKNRIPKQRLSLESAYAIACAETSDCFFFMSSKSKAPVAARIRVSILRSKISKRIAEGDEVTVVSDIVVLSCRRVRSRAPSWHLHYFGI